MKAKLGKLTQVKLAPYNSYKALLRKSIIGTLETEEQTSKYILLAGQHLGWKCGGKVPDKPLLYLNENYNTLKKEVKGDKSFDLKSYSYGTCKVVPFGVNVKLYLCPEKGKLTQAALLKPIQKKFKTFKPKVFIEIVDSLETIPLADNDSDALKGEDGGNISQTEVKA